MFFSAIKDDDGRVKQSCTPILSTGDSTLLKEKCSINTRWIEHFNNLLNTSSTVDPARSAGWTSLDNVGKAINKTTRENLLGWMGPPLRSSRQLIKLLWTPSTPSSQTYRKRKKCQKTTVMP